MNTQELQQMSVQELEAHVQELQEKGLALREGILDGSEKNYSQIKEIRREIARTHTVLGQKKASVGLA